MQYVKKLDIVKYIKELYEFEEKVFYEIVLSKEIRIAEDEEEYKISNSDIKNIHDTTYRNVLSNKREAYLFINNVLKLKNTENEISMDKLERCDNRYITSTYDNQETDIIYKRTDMEVYFLIEHQSSVDKSMAERIMEYIIEILRDNIDYQKITKAKYKIPLIIPIVLYTGKEKWKAEEYIVPMQVEMPGYKNKEFGRYILVDTNKYNEKELIEEEGALSKVILLERAENLEETYNKIKYEKMQEYEKRLIDEYTWNVSEKVLGKEKMLEIREKYRKKKGDKSMLVDVLMEMKEKYKEEGIQEGTRIGRIDGENKEKLKIAKALKKMGFRIEDIEKATKLSKLEIEKL